MAKDFDELYWYVKYDILNYDKNLHPRYLVLRLKGLSEGKFISRNNTKSMGSYTFTEILYTFKFSSINIKKAISKRSKFKNEEHLINTIMLIVEKNINDVVMRLRNLNKIDEKAKECDIFTRDENIEYINKDEKSESFKNKIKNLW